MKLLCYKETCMKTITINIRMTILISFFIGCAVLVYGDSITAPEEVPKPQVPLAYVELFEGLHVTGRPIEVDITAYRLHIRGLVSNELSFSFEEIKSMGSVTKEIVLECPGLFTDVGQWTGVPLMTLIEQAGPGASAESVVFSAIDDSYSVSLRLDEINSDGILVAYHFNDKEFHEYHGYPLRIVAEGWAGSKWVKWLGEIRVE
jgi:DMSO/TMAO reductase YedYZ molybdopterin-dependent catalytic subunit